MARPAGVAKATKDNSNKHPQQAKEFREGKKITRSKQIWVWDDSAPAEIKLGGIDSRHGHWEHING